MSGRRLRNYYFFIVTIIIIVFIIINFTSITIITVFMPVSCA